MKEKNEIINSVNIIDNTDHQLEEILSKEDLRKENLENALDKIREKIAILRVNDSIDINNEHIKSQLGAISNACEKVYLAKSKTQKIEFDLLDLMDDFNNWIQPFMKADDSMELFKEILVEEDFQPENLEKALNKIKNRIALIKSRKFDASDENDVLKAQAISGSIMNIFYAASKNKQLKLLFKNIVDDLNNWLIPINDPFFGSTTNFLPFLDECSCVNSGNFDRFKTSRRQDIEASILKFSNERFSNQKEAEISYLEMGAGGMLQSLIIITKLLLVGYSNLQVNLIDPIFKKISENTQYKLDQFNLLEKLATEMAASLSIKYFPSIDDYITTNLKAPDIITAIDFDDFEREAFNDTMKAHKTLDENGRMFLSIGLDEYEFSKSRVIKQNNKDEGMPSFVSEFPIKNNKHTKIASLIESNSVLHFIILPFIQKLKDVEQVTLSIPQPQEVNFFGTPKGAKKPNLNKSQENLEYYLQLLLPGITLKVNFFTGNKNFIKVFPQIKPNQDLVICYNKFGKRGKDSLFEDIQSLHKQFPNSDTFCAMQSATRNQKNKWDVNFKSAWIYNNQTKVISLVDGDEINREQLVNLYKSSGLLA